ncbi:hypothetical protein OKW76_12090 [Sphingomonas sp. S1-29]|uniref:hypothetical protein n=1 Tax=Sphingomonas sp. S1-29 TaxID=2991074 RepID=UPI0022406F13|nr:hypothetical protein [Sphingomonas sp. S1-29]UZK68774.1 hypothetical protein OKW76_12090 [Sphingomonas sp. S1-29]
MTSLPTHPPTNDSPHALDLGIVWLGRYQLEPPIYRPALERALSVMKERIEQAQCARRRHNGDDRDTIGDAVSFGDTSPSDNGQAAP